MSRVERMTGEEFAAWFDAFVRRLARKAFAEDQLLNDALARAGAMFAELSLLDGVCAAYVNDENRYEDGEGEPYGSIPVDVGIVARSARSRHLAAVERAKKA